MATTYNVYRDGEKIKSGLTAKSYTDTGLKPNTTYEYQVSAQNEFGESELSSPISVKTNGVEPDAPEELAVVDKTESTADLEWQ